MKEILPDIFAIEVPEDAKDFGCVHVFHGEDVVYYPDDKGETVPIGNAPCHCDQVEILFTTKDCNEEQARKLVKSHYSRQASFNPDLGHYQTSGSTTTYMDYVNGYCTLKKPTESLQSLSPFP